MLRQAGVRGRWRDDSGARARPRLSRRRARQVPGGSVARLLVRRSHRRPSHGVRQRVHLMNLAHVHLLLNHVPTIGFGFGIGLLVASLVRDSADLRRASYVVFFVVALVAIPTYLSGNAADFVLRTERELRQDVVTAHQNAAMLALIPMEIVGLLSWLALWPSRWRVPDLAITLSPACCSFLRFPNNPLRTAHSRGRWASCCSEDSACSTRRCSMRSLTRRSTSCTRL